MDAKLATRRIGLVLAAAGLAACGSIVPGPGTSATTASGGSSASGGSNATGGGGNSGNSGFTATLSGAATGSWNGTLSGLGPVTGGANQSTLSVVPGATLPAGVQSLSLNLTVEGTFTTTKPYSEGQFAIVAMLVGLDNGNGYGVGLDQSGKVAGKLTLALTNVATNGPSVQVKGTLDATMPNLDTTQTDSVTAHFSF